MIQFGRIELATYPNKPLDSMDFNEKEALNLSAVRSNQSSKSSKILNHEKNNLKIQNSFV
jgi:hypothetical protein